MLVVKVSRLQADGTLVPVVASADQAVAEQVLALIREALAQDNHDDAVDTRPSCGRQTRRPHPRQSGGVT